MLGIYIQISEIRYMCDLCVCVCCKLSFGLNHTKIMLCASQRLPIRRKEFGPNVAAIWCAVPFLWDDNLAVGT